MLDRSAPAYPINLHRMNLHRGYEGLDARLWGGLPEDIIERVLAFLPIADFLRFRCVCKRWNSLLSAARRHPEYVLPDSSSFRQPWFLCLTTVGSHPPTLQVFNAELRKWNELSLLFLPSELVDISVMACAGGLLYLHATVASNTIHVICNPLTKTWRNLPPINFGENMEMVSAGTLTSMMATDRNSDGHQGGRYKVIEAGFNGLTDLSTKIFDSSTRSWSTSGRIPSAVTGFESEGVLINDCLYGITCLPSKLLKLEVVEGGSQWSEFSAGLPSYAVYPHLVDSMGSLAVVAGYDPCWREGEVPDPTALKIWKLEESVMSWKEMSTLPYELCEKYLSSECGTFDSLKCAAHEEAIYVASYDGSVVLVYNSTANSWSLLPECLSLANGLSCVEQFFVFKPSLCCGV